MSKRVAFVIPVKITENTEVARDLQRFVTEVSDVYVILSRESDLTVWKRMAGQRDTVRTLIMSDWIAEDVIATAEANRCMPAFKKWAGLLRLLTNYEGADLYDYCLCCDCEINMLLPLDANFIALLPSQFVFIGDHVHRSEWHDNFSRLILAETRAHVKCSLLAESPECSDTVYTWWSGLPIYATSGLLDFMQFIGMYDPTTLVRSMSCVTFDHLIYQRYLLMKGGLHGARVVCLTHDLKRPLGWSLELASTSEIMTACREAGLATLWTTRVMKLKHHGAVFGAYIECHTDRTAALE